MKTLLTIISTGIMLSAVPVYAHKLIKPEPQAKIARKAFSATPETSWNRLSQKGGKYQEIWTLDGDKLNKITFFGGVPIGDPLFKERDKKRSPLPKVEANMLMTDIAELVESTYRTQFQATRMEIGVQEPAELAGYPGVRFEYRFVRPDDQLERRGEALGAFVDGRLYLMSYEAPALHFFERDVDRFRALVATTTINQR